MATKKTNASEIRASKATRDDRSEGIEEGKRNDAARGQLFANPEALEAFYHADPKFSVFVDGHLKDRLARHQAAEDKLAALNAERVSLGLPMVVVQDSAPIVKASPTPKASVRAPGEPAKKRGPKAKGKSGEEVATLIHDDYKGKDWFSASDAQAKLKISKADWTKAKIAGDKRFQSVGNKRGARYKVK